MYVSYVLYQCSTWLTVCTRVYMSCMYVVCMCTTFTLSTKVQLVLRVVVASSSSRGSSSSTTSSK